MWDAAAEMGPSMQPGEFFLIKNARMMTNHYSGYLKGKLQQNKIVRLTAADADTNPQLKALLELASSFIFLPIDAENSKKKTGEKANGKETSLI
jgi:hypothetical protein